MPLPQDTYFYPWDMDAVSDKDLRGIVAALLEHMNAHVFVQRSASGNGDMFTLRTADQSN